jgi:hypothetical protein
MLPSNPISMTLQTLQDNRLYSSTAFALITIPIIALILRLLTPKPLPGIPHLKNQWPILGDLHKLIRHVRKTNGVTSFFDDCAKELGEPPLFQLMMGS